MKICILFNPTAAGERARRFEQHLMALSQAASLQPTVGPGSARALAAAAVQQEFDTIVAAGGDGTLNEVLNGIADVPDGLARTRLGLIPMGTANVFAKELGLPLDPQQAWEVIRAGRDTRIDLALAEYTQQGTPARRYFAQLAGAGFDARSIELVNWETKKRLGFLAYLTAATRALRTPGPPIIVQAGTQTTTGEMVLVGNGRLYGGRFVVFPRADLRDGLLEVVVFPKVDWDMVLRCGWGLLWQSFNRSGRLIELRADRVQLTAPAAVRFQVEGETIGQLLVTFSVVPRALQVIVP